MNPTQAMNVADLREQLERARIEAEKQRIRAEAAEAALRELRAAMELASGSQAEGQA